MNKLVNVKLHGILGEQMGQSEWQLAVKNVGDAVRGIQCNTKTFYSQLLENDKKNIRYRVLINDQDFEVEEGKDPNTEEGWSTSGLMMKKGGIESIDIVPVLEGSDDFMAIFTIIIGIVLIATGVGAAFAGTAFGSFATASAGMQAAFVMGGIGLIAAGVTNLMTEMPKFGDFREIEQGGGKAYLLGGPQNTVREGGPVFVGYGRLVIGSHVIQSAVDTVNSPAEVLPKDTWGQTKYGLLYNIPNAGGLLANRVSKWGSNPND